MKTILPFVIAFLLTNSVTAQTWHYVGSGGVSATSIAVPSLVLDPNGNPWVAFADNNYLPTVMKWNGSAWETIGNAGFEGSTTGTISLAIDQNGTPYVAYADGVSTFGQHGKLTVIKWNGTSWAYVGSPGISDTTAMYLSIACDPNGVPYVAYTDGADGNTGNLGKGIVKKWNGTSWVQVGAPEVNTDLSQVGYPTVGFDPSGNAYLAYYNQYNNAGFCSKLLGGYWNTQGGTLAPWFSQSVVQYVSLAFDTGGTPYVGFQDAFNGATVTKLTSQGWTTVGTPSFTSTVANYTSLAIDPSGTPYIAYQAGAQGKAAVEKFNGTSWVPVGASNYITIAEADYTSLAIDAQGTPYLAFIDYAYNQKLTVMRYGTSTTGIAEPADESPGSISVAPNPSNGLFVVHFSSTENQSVSIAVFDMLGRQVYSKEPFACSNGTSQSIDLSGVAQGSYVLKVQADGTVVNKKLQVQ